MKRADLKRVIHRFDCGVGGPVKQSSWSINSMAALPEPSCVVDPLNEAAGLSKRRNCKPAHTGLPE